MCVLFIEGAICILRVISCNNLWKSVLQRISGALQMTNQHIKWTLKVLAVLASISSKILIGETVHSFTFHVYLVLILWNNYATFLLWTLFLKFKHKIFHDKSSVCHNVNWLNKMYFIFMCNWNKVVVEACNVIVVFNIDVHCALWQVSSDKLWFLLLA